MVGLGRLAQINKRLKQAKQAGDKNAEFRLELERLASGEFSVEDWKNSNNYMKMAQNFVQ